MRHVTRMNASFHKHECMAHICTSHVTSVDESCHTYERVMACHKYKWVVSHIWMSHVTRTNESCQVVSLTHALARAKGPQRNSAAWVTSHFCKWVLSHIYEWVMSRARTRSRAKGVGPRLHSASVNELRHACMNESCHTCMDESCVTHMPARAKRVDSQHVVHRCMSHVTHVWMRHVIHVWMRHTHTHTSQSKRSRFAAP